MCVCVCMCLYMCVCVCANAFVCESKVMNSYCIVLYTVRHKGLAYLYAY